MKTLRNLLLIGLLSTAGIAFGQATCSNTNPCSGVTVNNPFMATNPGTATIYKCMGSPTNCSAAALAQFIASPATPSPWSATAPFPQTTAMAAYNDPQPWGSLMNYASQNSTVAGGPGPVSAITIFQVPSSPVPPAPSLSVKSVTSGAVGPQ